MSNPIYKGWPWQGRFSVPAGYLEEASTLKCTIRYKSTQAYGSLPIFRSLETGDELSHSITGGGADDIIQIDLTAAITAGIIVARGSVYIDFRIVVSGNDNDIYIGPPTQVTISTTVTPGEGFD